MAAQGERAGGTASRPDPTAADLVLARDRLLGPVAGLAADALRDALADLHEFWLAAHATRAGLTGEASGIALVAVGGLGRRELVPYSDLDLLLVHDRRTANPPAGVRIADLAERLWYPLWNAGIGLDHSVRTVAEAVDVAATDLRTALGLLDARHIAGDAEVSERLVTAARARWRSGVRGRLRELTEDARRRWERTGEVAHWVAPDLKHGRGGLRDVAILLALATGQVADRPAGEVARAHRLLLDTRTELRRIARRPRDVLRPEDGDAVAEALGVGDRFTLARALSGAGRTIAYAVDVALRSGAAPPAAQRGRMLGMLRRGPERTPLDEGVVLHGGEVVLARGAEPGRDPALLLRVAAAAARTGRPIAAGTLARLDQAAPEPRAPWPADVRQELITLLGAGDGLVDVVEALDRTGLWARLFPEWGVVRDLPPRDPVHSWTVDRHLIQATANAARLVTAVARPDLLLLGTLLHDLGKGRDADHSEVGAALAGQVGRRLGLPERDVAALSAMVRHHLLLPHTATRRNIDDEATVLRVVDTLGGDPVLLDLLHALSEADARATGPGVWSDWRATLTAELVARCRLAMAGERFDPPEPLSQAQRELAEAVAAGGRPDVLVDQATSPSSSISTVTLVAPDRPGLLADAAGVLALHSLEAHAALLRSHAGVAVDVFSVTPRFGTLPDPGLLREQFARAASGSLPLAERLASKERDYGGRRGEPVAAPAVRWFDDEAGHHTAVVLELRAADRIGLLYGVAGALERCAADVLWARVTAMGPTVVGAFALAAAGQAALDGSWRRRVERAVLAAC